MRVQVSLWVLPVAKEKLSSFLDRRAQQLALNIFLLTYAYFLDTADVDEVYEASKTDLIDGVTTNPTLIKKAGLDPIDVYSRIADLGIPDISMEVMGDYDAMLSEAYKLQERFQDIATIKLPMTVDGLKVCSTLSEFNIRTNITLVFNTAQAVLAAKA